MIHFYIGRKSDKNKKMPPGAEKAIEEINRRGGLELNLLSDKYHYISVTDPDGDVVAVVTKHDMDVSEGYVAKLCVDSGENLKDCDVPQVKR